MQTGSPVPFRLSEKAVALIGEMSERHGLSKTDVVELAIRQLARRGVAPIEEPRKRQKKGD